MPPVLRSAILADANAIATVYLRSRKTFLPFAPLIHTDESIRQWVSHKLLVTEQVIVAEEKSIISSMLR